MAAKSACVLTASMAPARIPAARSDSNFFIAPLTLASPLRSVSSSSSMVATWASVSCKSLAAWNIIPTRPLRWTGLAVRVDRTESAALGHDASKSADSGAARVPHPPLSQARSNVTRTDSA
jgi:hypothetical protein